MKTAAAALHPPASEGGKPSAGTKTEWLAIMRVQEPHAASQHIPFDLLTSIWCGAMVGCIGAPVTAPFPESRS